jgi:HlyD family secretion protein
MNFSAVKLKSRRTALVAAAIAIFLALVGAWTLSPRAQEGKAAEKKAASAGKPALSVTLITPQVAEWPQVIAANGNIAAWQEAVIGAEISGYRLTDVLVNVGDMVKKGQLLARISSDTMAAELAQSKAAAAEAEATLAEARANAARARQIEHTGAFSAQQIAQYLTAEATAEARLNAARAKVQADELRLAHTRVIAPDDGVISSRAATAGSLTQPGQELFRLIRGGRLEWRAEVTASELGRIKPGMAASLAPPGATATAETRIRGKVRMVAPTVDAQSRNAVVYVDLPTTSGVRAGMFARGEFELGKGNALTLPQSAVLLRDGFSYVYRLDGDSKVAQVKVTVGRRVGERIEITGGLEPNTRVVASGAGFLADGDVVRVVDEPVPAVKAASK